MYESIYAKTTEKKKKLKGNDFVDQIYTDSKQFDHMQKILNLGR